MLRRTLGQRLHQIMGTLLHDTRCILIHALRLQGRTYRQKQAGSPWSPCAGPHCFACPAQNCDRYRYSGTGRGNESTEVKGKQARFGPESALGKQQKIPAFK